MLDIAPVQFSARIFPVKGSMRKRTKHFLSAGVAPVLGCGLAVMLTACAPVGPDYTPPQSQVPVAWSGSGGQGPSVEVEDLAHWWTLFDDPLLNSLMQRALAANHDLRVAEARILQARAQYRMITAVAAPAIGASGAYTDTRRGENVSGSGSGTTQDLFQAGLDAGWELDLFGGARRAAEGAQARLDSVAESRSEVLLSLPAELARNYLELRAFQQRTDAARDNLVLLDKTLEMARGRLGIGLASQVEVSQAETQLALGKALPPPLETGKGQAIYRISLLLGLEPAALVEELSAPLPLPSGSFELPRILPSDLLRRRPDIRRAERQLAAATADIGVATAELFPRLSLTGLVGLQSADLGDLLSAGSRYWTVGPSVRWSLFNGGRVRANIDLGEARRQEVQVLYEKTVLGALAEVEASLLALEREEQATRALEQALASALQSVELATGRYRAGLEGYADVLLAQRALYQSRDQLLQSRQRRSQNYVALFKALGGGWDQGSGRDESMAAAGKHTSPGDLK